MVSDYTYEIYEKEDIDEVINPGDVIEVTPTGKYRKTQTRFSEYVVGVCVQPNDSDEDLIDIQRAVYDIYDGSVPGVTEGSTEIIVDPKYVCVAIAGKVPVNITGLACVGDVLVSSCKEGIAMAYDRCKVEDGVIIGKVVDLTENVNQVIMQVMLS